MSTGAAPRAVLTRCAVVSQTTANHVSISEHHQRPEVDLYVANGSSDVCLTESCQDARHSVFDASVTHCYCANHRPRPALPIRQSAGQRDKHHRHNQNQDACSRVVDTTQPQTITQSSNGVARHDTSNQEHSQSANAPYTYGYANCPSGYTWEGQNSANDTIPRSEECNPEQAVEVETFYEQQPLDNAIEVQNHYGG